MQYDDDDDDDDDCNNTWAPSPQQNPTHSTTLQIELCKKVPWGWERREGFIQQSSQLKTKQNKTKSCY
jgi:hypothetical protein